MTLAPVEIVAAESGRAHREFIALPYRLYRGDPIGSIPRSWLGPFADVQVLMART